MLPFHRPFGAFSFCVCLTGASPLPVLHRLSEALSYKHCWPYQQKSEWYTSSRRVPLYVCIYIKVFLLCFPHQLRRSALFCSEINDFCIARHSFARKSMIFALHGTLSLGNQ
ncbi:hypothetical protein HMPREF0658_1939 [Hoylesella marshii DSM 16973 = JCM 13450]|uniref:Uncharacterized protein n=1 Tax=Hoylesella marshii DSM 16973 = JCM 13450 TaxID=862515 RepID=E0NUT4_9BACT|nr:hypothetical protein HMPREF0658_1939 [Hoylesella marshii DSM 16973 = JCM 13450]